MAASDWTGATSGRDATATTNVSTRGNAVDEKITLTIPEDEAHALLAEIESIDCTDKPMLVRLASNLEVSLGELDYERGEGSS
jgi:hypothetical protein